MKTFGVDSPLDMQSNHYWAVVDLALVMNRRCSDTAPSLLTILAQTLNWSCLLTSGVVSAIKAHAMQSFIITTISETISLAITSSNLFWVSLLKNVNFFPWPTFRFFPSFSFTALKFVFDSYLFKMASNRLIIARQKLQYFQKVSDITRGISCQSFYMTSERALASQGKLLYLWSSAWSSDWCSPLSFCSRLYYPTFFYNGLQRFFLPKQSLVNFNINMSFGRLVSLRH